MKSVSRSRIVRSAFTLVELLVVIGIIALLVACLLPALATAREEAKNITCANNVRQLCAACVMYQDENRGLLPPPVYNDSALDCYPSDLQTRLMNRLAPYLNAPQLADTPDPLPKPTDLPRVFCNPVIWENMAMTGPGTNGPTYWHTGYAYFGRLDECTTTTGEFPGVQLPTILTPDRVGTQTHRGVIFADEIVWYGYGADIWIFPHGPGVVDSYSGPKLLKGQHCGFSDGSVEWRSASTINIDPTNKDATAGYKLNAGIWYYYWWF